MCSRGSPITNKSGLALAARRRLQRVIESAAVT
jgi:hypothetical protein